jgi:hypothetical protein
MENMSLPIEADHYLNLCHYSSVNDVSDRNLKAFTNHVIDIGNVNHYTLLRVNYSDLRPRLHISTVEKFISG